MDEAAHVDKGVFYKMIFPVSQVKKSALWLITSPMDSANWLSELQDMEDENGTPLMFSHTLKTICPECSVKEPLEMRKCRHCGNVLQDVGHKDSVKRSRYALIYTFAGLEEVNKNENEGQVTQSSSCCFDKEYVKAVFTSERVSHVVMDIKTYIKEIIVTVDPNAGGANECAMAIGYYCERTNFAVVSILHIIFPPLFLLSHESLLPPSPSILYKYFMLFHHIFNLSRCIS